MNNENSFRKLNPLVWSLKIGDKSLEIELEELKKATKGGFYNVSYAQKQKLVYELLEFAKNKDQRMFFYTLLRAINKPKEKFDELWKLLEKYYDILPEEAFVDFAYSIIIGIMSTYAEEK